MTKRHPIPTRFLFALLIVSSTVADVDAQDSGKVAMENPRVVFENDQVRVVEYIARPHEGVCGFGIHSHPAHLTVVLDTGRVKVTLPDGKSVERATLRDAVFWSEAGTHSVENVATTDSRRLIIEIKERKALPVNK